MNRIWMLNRRLMAKTGTDGGQATAEYALVMLAAAALAGGVLAWVISSDAVARLMDAVLDSVIGEVNP